MRIRELPSQEYLKECFDYDPETGLLTWKIRPREHFKNERSFNSFNGRFVGNVALNSVSRGYCGGTLDRKTVLTHRIIWKWWYGEDPLIILHENGKTTDNRIAKLSNGTQSVNMLDQKKPKNNSSGVIGVYWHNLSGKWCAQIKINGKTKHLGSFDIFENAVDTRKKVEIELGFHTRHGRN